VLAEAWPRLVAAYAALPCVAPPTNGTDRAWQAALAGLVAQGFAPEDVRDALLWALTSPHSDAEWWRGNGLDFPRAAKSFRHIARQFAKATRRGAAAIAPPQEPEPPPQPSVSGTDDDSPRRLVAGALTGATLDGWERAKAALRAEMAEEEFAAWIEPVAVELQADSALAFFVASDFYRRVFARKYWPRVAELLSPG